MKTKKKTSRKPKPLNRDEQKTLDALRHMLATSPTENWFVVALSNAKDLIETGYDRKTVLQDLIAGMYGRWKEAHAISVRLEDEMRVLRRDRAEIAARPYSWREVSDGEFHVFTPHGDSIGKFKDQAACMAVCVACNNGRTKPCPSPKTSSTSSNNPPSARSGRSKAR